MTASDWCPVCSTQHADGHDCPGQLLATGPERHGRRVAVSAGGRTEIYGVLIAECRDRWRARLLTYPNMLWSVPGGRGAMKFVGASAHEVEERAMRYLREHCAERGVEVLEEGVALDPSSVPAPGGPGAVTAEDAPVKSPIGAKDPRHLQRLAVRFGVEKATIDGVTSDLSRNGLFVATDAPLAKGRTVRLMLEIDRFTVPLVGRVIWSSDAPKGSKPAGMGVQLADPPPMYLRHVRAMEQATEEPA